MNKSILLALVGMCMALGCQNRSSQSPDSGEVIRIDVRDVKNDPADRFNSLFHYKRYVVLENNDSALIGRIGKIKLYGGSIYVLDSKTYKILAFDSQGNYLRQYAHIGNGPNEYTNLQDFDIVGDTLYLIGRYAKNLLKYDLQTDTCYGSTKIEMAEGLYVLPDGGYALNLGLGKSDGSKQAPQSYAVYKHNDLKWRGIPFNKHLTGYAFALGEGSNQFYTTADGVLTGFPFNDTLYTVSPADGSLTPHVAIQVNDKHIDPDTPKADTDKLRRELSSSIFAYYNWKGYHFFSYYRGDDPRTYVVASPEGGIVFHGHFATDSNRLMIRVVPYDTSDADKPMLSMLYPYEIIDLANDAPHSPLLGELASKVTAEGNPVLIFYDFMPAKASEAE